MHVKGDNMEASGFGGGQEGGGTELLNPADRGDFVADIVSNFERNRMAVASDVVAYIRGTVLVGDKEWEDGVRDGRIDLSQTHKILVEALEESGALADRVGRPMLDITLAEPTFVEVVHDRWNCPYPFLIC
jgi:hypothetical protein